MGQLQHFHIIERFLEDDEAIALPEFLYDLFPGIIGISRANHNLQVRAALPNLVDRLHSIPAGGHSTIDESQGVRATFPLGDVDFVEAFLPLKSGVELKTGSTRSVGWFAENERFIFLERFRRSFRA